MNDSGSSLPTALIYSPLGSNTQADRDLEMAGWSVKLASSDLESWTEQPSHIWVIDVSTRSIEMEQLMQELWEKRFSVPLMIVVREELIATYWQRLVQLKQDWPAPFQMLVAPYPLEELLLRVVFLTREGLGEGGVLVHGRFQLDVGRYEARYGDRVVPLTPCEFQIFRALMEAGGKVVSKRELLRALHGAEEHYDESVVKVYVNRLRNRLEQAGADRTCVRAIQGVGYRLDRG
ncbi:putative two component transcriptional regulator, winged helix family [Thermobaculum terrenum ATCC BAA-798]|uniref:Putative two component transcriptional regulator, winged helix family n=1 Tax=Thermobaculum terrenum (strain ATCC BAA-798 / CCMEE 7001 / YNP1) TaxID=525904 RepID=D1CGP2_THET1|nr:response regulator transcription factor [Thermobaculum terrenum]ACZ42913.1 putative two component transcriptional regulator, winged helix family [Thermobaculum terrenum ATCC BAA-798]